MFKTSYIAFHLHFNGIFMHLDVCNMLVCWVGLDWAEPMMSFCFTCHMFMHFPCIRTLLFIYLIYLNCLGLSDCSSLFLLLNLFTLVVSMAPKHKSTPAQNPLHSGASSSIDPSPSTVRFHDDDAFKAFLENFSR